MFGMQKSETKCIYLFIANKLIKIIFRYLLFMNCIQLIIQLLAILMISQKQSVFIYLLQIS